MIGVLCIIFCILSASVADVEDSQDIEVRLRGGKSINEGRVEIKYNEEWGTICDDDWDMSAANVICRMLGFEGAMEYVHSGNFGPGEGTIFLDNVHCTGEEASVASCEHRGFGVNDCSHHEDAGVKCNARRLPGFFKKDWHRSFETSFDLMRLKAPRGTKKRLPQVDGYLEIYHEGKWRHVCSDGWTFEAATVVCGQLGFPAASKMLHMHRTKKKKTNYWLSNVTCDGDETMLEECNFTFLNITSNEPCPTDDPVHLRCVPGELYTLASFKKSIKNAKRRHHHRQTTRLSRPEEKIRLKAGSMVGEGRLEVMRDGRWGTICHRGWDIRDTNVACRQLGFGTAKRFYMNSEFGMAHGPIWMSNVDCIGTETKLEECHHDRISEDFEGYRSIDTDECSHFEEVGIACNVPEMNSAKKIRIVGGRNPLEGRVEVQVGRKWGPVCSDDWTAKEATIVCRQLGLGFALRALKEVWFYPGSEDAGGLAMSGVKCNGNEIALQYCPHDGKKGAKTCGDERRTMTPFAGVICTEGSPDLILDIPFLQDSIHMEDAGLSRLLCAAEENCLSSSANDVDLRYSYGHRRLLRFSSRVWNRGTADFRPARLPNDWEWHACHGHFHSMGEFTHYDILSLNKTKVAEGHKASFCLEDTHCDADVEPRYDCDQPGGGTQGIAVGCSDTYAYNIDCQWIDITDLEKGNFLFKVHINPNHLVPESNFGNNEVICNMKYDGREIWVWNCHIADDYDPVVIAKYYTASMYP